jgi:hypothetical protein
MPVKTLAVNDSDGDFCHVELGGFRYKAVVLSYAAATEAATSNQSDVIQPTFEIKQDCTSNLRPLGSDHID